MNNKVFLIQVKFRHKTNQQNAKQTSFKTSNSSRQYLYQASNLKSVCKSPRNLSSETGEVEPFYLFGCLVNALSAPLYKSQSRFFICFWPP